VGPGAKRECFFMRPANLFLIKHFFIPEIIGGVKVKEEPPRLSGKRKIGFDPEEQNDFWMKSPIVVSRK
jgi:hypothetical protein